VTTTTSTLTARLPDGTPGDHLPTGDDEPWPGITTITRLLDRPGLNRWRMRQVAEYAIDQASWIAEQSAADRRQTVDQLCRAPGRVARRAASRGTRVHAIAQAIADGRPVRKVPAELAPYVDAELAFLRDHAPQFVAAEATVYSLRHRYIGRLDWLARLGGVLTLGDIKTGERVPVDEERPAVYDEVSLQLSALAHADHMLVDGRLEPLPRVEAALALYLSPHGYRPYPATIDGWVWEAFLGLRAAWEFTQRRGAAIGAPLAAGVAPAARSAA
jgi:hypothetical protein